jgi:RNA polymerase sigma-70 factor (ECF subfamily)
MDAGRSDEELVAAHRGATVAGEREETVNELFRRHYAKVAYWCLRLTGDREWAADLAQEVFVKAFRHLDSYQGTSKFSTWLYSIARNHCWSEIRARQSRAEDLGDAPLFELPDTADTPYAAAEKADALRMLRELVNSTLDEMEKKVVMLYYSEELSLDAITRMLELRNASGAKALLVAARRKLERAVRQMKARAGK